MLWRTKSKISDTNMALFNAIAALTPGTEGFLDEQALAPIDTHYKSNMDDFQMEVQQMRRMIERKRRNKQTLTFLVKIS